MQRFLRRFVGSRSLLNGIEAAKVLLLSRPLNMSLPFVPLGNKGHASEATFVIGLNCLVLKVFGLIGFAKVLKSIVVSNAINMVDCVRKSPLVHRPYEPVFGNVESRYSAIYVSTFDLAAKPFAFLLLSVFHLIKESAATKFQERNRFLQHFFKNVFGDRLCHLDSMNVARIGTITYGGQNAQ